MQVGNVRIAWRLVLNNFLIYSKCPKLILGT